MAEFNLAPFLSYCAENGIAVPPAAPQQLALYGNLLLEWNQKINLTAITDPQEIVLKHFTDCAALLRFLPLKPGQSLIDVGTGAGFPGAVLKILVPQAKVTLLDGHAKRFLFLNDFMQQSGLTCQTLHSRAELAAKQPEYREQFQYATARAVAALPTLLEYCLPFVKPGGLFAAMTGPGAGEEAAAAANAAGLLGGSPAAVQTYTLPGELERAVVTVKKISQTSAKYPRASAKITKQPL